MSFFQLSSDFPQNHYVLSMIMYRGNIQRFELQTQYLMYSTSNAQTTAQLMALKFFFNASLNFTIKFYFENKPSDHSRISCHFLTI